MESRNTCSNGIGTLMASGVDKVLKFGRADAGIA
jgi:hypothetical protein